MKTIGVLGGLGPQATMDFVARLHRVSQGLLSPRMNTGYPPTVVYYLRQPPFVMGNDGTPLQPVRPAPALLDAARKLGACADFLVIPSNSPHMVLPDVEKAAGVPVLSMIRLTIDEVVRLGWRRAGVAGLSEPRVYTDPLEDAGIACETLDPSTRSRLDAAIFALMEGRNDTSSTESAADAVAFLRDRDVDGIILGCTEIPLLLGEAAREPGLLSPAQLLAEAAIHQAIEGDSPG